MRNKYFQFSLYRLSGPSFIVGLIIISVFFGCSSGFDPMLLEIDSKLEDHPDSAMMLLDEYKLAPGASKADSAYWGLLLTHARYKNFIDETDDSLINASADYFLKNGDNERASRSLFLKGRIQMNANRLGEAAVSFKKGLDIAREGEHYMWEGQCARGLYVIYGNLKNASEQIKYALEENNAYIKGDYREWANYSKLNIMRAYHNNGLHKRALDGTIDLLAIAQEQKDSALIAECMVLIGTCRYSLEDYKGALDSYLAAYSMNPFVIEYRHSYNIEVSAANIDRDSISSNMNDFIDTMIVRVGGMPLFKEMANAGRFKEAYYSLEYYKNIQDSVLKEIMQNGVSESLDQYESTKNIIRLERLRNERLSWCIIILSLLLAVFFSIWWYRKHMGEKVRECEQLESSLESLRLDLGMLMIRNEEIMTFNNNIKEKNAIISSSLLNILHQRYSKINELCDSYFQNRLINSKKKEAEKEMERILSDFSDSDFLKEMGSFIDQCFDNLYSSFIEDYPNLKDDSRRLFMFLTLGLSTRTMCVIFDIEPSNLYNRKSRLKKLIIESCANRKEEYLSNVK